MAKKKKKKKNVKTKNIRKKTNSKKKKQQKKSIKSNVKTSKSSNKLQEKKDLNKKNEKGNRTTKKEDLKTKNNTKIVESKKNIKTKIKKVFLLFVFFIFIGLIVFFVKLVNENSNENNIEFYDLKFEEYLNSRNSEDLQFIYITNDSCMNCDNYEISINKLQIEYKLNIKKLNFSNLKQDEIEKLKESSASLNKGIDVPALLAIKGGNEINYIAGIKEYSVLRKFIENSLNPSDVNSFEKILVDKYLNLLNSKETTFIYIGSSNNKGCKTFLPVLEKVSNKRNIKVYYLNTDGITTSSDWEKIQNSSKIFEDVWFMPTILVVKNGKIKDYKMEILNEKELEKFLKKNGL